MLVMMSLSDGIDVIHYKFREHRFLVLASHTEMNVIRVWKLFIL